MKTPLLLLSLLLSFFSDAQNYLQPGSQWRINATGLSMSGPCYFTEQFVCEITGDSLVGGQTYKIIRCHGLKTEGPTMPGPHNCAQPSTFNRLYALIRQDSLKMYINDNGSEQLLYDFDLQVGDMLPLTYNNYDDQVMIDSITTIQVGNETRKVFHFTQQNQAYQINKIIEGIGHNWGFIGIMQPFEFFELNLECYAINDTVYYPYPDAPCGLDVGLSEQPEVVLLNSYPNPAEDAITIETGALNGIRTCNVVDAYGNKCSVERKETEAGSMQLDLSTANPGLYIVTLVDSDGKTGVVRVVKL